MQKKDAHHQRLGGKSKTTNERPLNEKKRQPSSYKHLDKSLIRAKREKGTKQGGMGRKGPAVQQSKNGLGRGEIS